MIHLHRCCYLVTLVTSLVATFAVNHQPKAWTDGLHWLAVREMLFQKLHNKGRIFFQYFSHDTQKHGYALFPDETLTSDAYHDIDYIQGQVLAEIEGPINGLFCLSNCEDRVIIWNPAIREFRTLPYPYHPNLPPHLEVYEYSIGFGLDPLTGEFKLVLIRQVENFKKRALDAYVTIFTLCTNTWRHLDGLDHLTGDCLLSPSTTGKHVDGVYYWWTGYAILTFDMGMEAFHVIPAPVILPSELYCSYCNVLYTTITELRCINSKMCLRVGLTNGVMSGNCAVSIQRCA
ncbi:hypothetical protein RHSIM_Rhsim08G0189600 [Rhododendron simsii]|uniref:F-box associated beta-propeller type 3 domain-containing protein n=1 Tax=Rhododendron simsii TaxID=118357 RepID=A0A834LI28_RHOSS|nr:hypothetical protein RHSIM_Rhsim08G0189600 [Rhododendron simsii]